MTDQPSPELLSRMRFFSGPVLTPEELAYVFSGDRRYLRRVAELALGDPATWNDPMPEHTAADHEVVNG